MHTFDLPLQNSHISSMNGSFTSTSVTEITALLQRSEAGEDTAFSMAVARLYPELRRLTAYQLKGGSEFTLGATDVLHEAYLKLSSYEGAFANRQHFMAVASRAIRQVTVDYARRRSAVKRGGQAQRVEFEEDQLSVADQASELLNIDQMLEQLAGESEQLARIFECRFFGGMSDADTSAALNISVRSVQRGWAKAKAFMVELHESSKEN